MIVTYSIPNMLHSIEYKPSCSSMDIPTFRVIKPAAKEALIKWHAFSYPYL